MITDTKIIILAAGKGTRMHSNIEKVMHPVGSLSLLGHVINNLSFTKIASCSVVSHKDNASVNNFIKNNYPKIKLYLQAKQLGTADGIKAALNDGSMDFKDTDNVIILFADSPFINSKIIEDVVAKLNNNYAITVVGCYPDSPKSYGRLVCNKDGTIEKIIECKNADKQQQEIVFCNSGIMGLQYATLAKLINKIKPQKDNGEYYLTDIVNIAIRHNIAVNIVTAEYEKVKGVNTQQDLAQAEQIFQQNKRTLMQNLGVTLTNPHSVYFAYDTKIAPGVIVEPNVYFGLGVEIGQNSVIKSFSYISESKIGSNVTIGPFAHLRANTQILDEAKVGNFVEIKKSILGFNSKVNHLSYIGDSKIGKKVNIGAGTITCNYDGHNKHQTNIDDEAFIGSNTSLIAPINIGKQAIVGAGSTITKDVNAGDLAISRPIQQNKTGLGKKLRKQNK